MSHCVKYLKFKFIFIATTVKNLCVHGGQQTVASSQKEVNITVKMNFLRCFMQ